MVYSPIPNADVYYDKLFHMYHFQRQHSNGRKFTLSARKTHLVGEGLRRWSMSFSTPHIPQGKVPDRENQLWPFYRSATDEEVAEIKEALGG